jgi:hypothetical protein
VLKGRLERQESSSESYQSWTFQRRNTGFYRNICIVFVISIYLKNLIPIEKSINHLWNHFNLPLKIKFYYYIRIKEYAKNCNSFENMHLTYSS